MTAGVAKCREVPSRARRHVPLPARRQDANTAIMNMLNA
jgi:hypothetical protein